MGQKGKTQKSQDGASADSGAVVLDGSKPIDNMRWERFCQLYAGKCFGNGAEAYRQAGYKPKTNDSAANEASRLLGNDRIDERITHLRQESVRYLGIDRIHILKTRLQCLNDKCTAWGDRLKAADAIEKSLGWNEPDKKDIKLSGTIINIDFLDEPDDPTETD